MTIVWFKKDLRIADHAPLSEAMKDGFAVGFFCVESEWLKAPSFHLGKWNFLSEALESLKIALDGLNVPLVVVQGDVIEELHELRKKIAYSSIYSHEEVGELWTYRRDQQVRRFCQGHNIKWLEYPDQGVSREVRSQDLFASTWKHRMDSRLIDVPTPSRESVPTKTNWSRPPSAKNMPQRWQEGSAEEAEKTLSSFIDSRCEGYLRGLSSPISAVNDCSRLSPYFAWGMLSVREVHQRVELALEKMPRFDRDKIKGLTAFKSRLAWQGHFCQRFERAHFMEWANLNPGFDGMREPCFNSLLFEAWKEAQTGFPFVDACMRFLKARGWINFRMRAMLMSFASYHLWLHWKLPGDYLAGLFLDFHAGIHWSQVQMQSGTTGINIPRIYCPLKQQLDQDPSGSFVRKWVPELARLPDVYLHQPWNIPPFEAISLGFYPGKSYPLPIVDPRHAMQSARARYTTFFKSLSVRSHSKEIYALHGSRKKNTVPKKDRIPKTLGKL